MEKPNHKVVKITDEEFVEIEKAIRQFEKSTVGKQNDGEFNKCDDNEVDIYVNKSFEAIKELAGGDGIAGKSKYFWLGARRSLIRKLVGSIAEINEEQDRLVEIKRCLDRYGEDLKELAIDKEGKLGRAKTLYHGSVETNIKKFTPRIMSLGDEVELVYAAYDRNFSLSFIFEKNGLCHKALPGYKGKNAYYKGLSLKGLIERDIGGSMYEFRNSGIFGTAMAKDMEEVVSRFSVDWKRKVPVVSALNELALAKDYDVFYDDGEIKGKRLELEDLRLAREEYMEDIKKDPQKKRLLTRLKEQQKDLNKRTGRGCVCM